MLDGQTQVSVAKDLKTVRYIFQKYMKTSKVADAKRSGRPLKTTERQRRLLGRTSNINPFDRQGSLGCIQKNAKCVIDDG